MDFFDAASESKVIPEEHLQQFLTLVKGGEYRWILTNPDINELRLQGDILRSLTFALVAADGKIQSKYSPGMILNNTCDLQPGRSSSVLIAAAMDYDRYAEGVLKNYGQEKGLALLQNIKANKINEILYIPNTVGDWKAAIILFDTITTVSTDFYESTLEGKRIASLTTFGFYFVLAKLSWFFCRPQSGDIKRQEV